MKGEVSRERFINFLKDEVSMNLNQHQLLSFKEQLGLKYLVHLVMHNRSFVYRRWRWINSMRTKIRQYLDFRLKPRSSSSLNIFVIKMEKKRNTFKECEDPMWPTWKII